MSASPETKDDATAPPAAPPDDATGEPLSTRRGSDDGSDDGSEGLASDSDDDGPGLPDNVNAMLAKILGSSAGGKPVGPVRSKKDELRFRELVKGCKAGNVGLYVLVPIHTIVCPTATMAYELLQCP